MMINQFSRMITLCRNELGLPQKKVSEDLGISQALLSHYEKGTRECGLEFVVKAAKYYGVSADYLLGLSASKNGETLSAEELPDESISGKENTYKGNILATLNKKLIFNSLNIVFDLLTESQNKNVIAEASNYISISVYKVFRYLYAYNKDNPDMLFACENALFSDYCMIGMNLSEMKLRAMLSQTGSKKIARVAIDSPRFELNGESIEKSYPQFASSLFNLIQNTEVKIGARSK